jgi:hypothetical protein
MVKLKKGQETFQVVDGPDAGRTFERGVEYDIPPKGYKDRFEAVKLSKPVEVKIIEKGGKTK